jgi:hypothetical protein
MRTILSRNIHVLYISFFSLGASFVFFRSNLGIQLGPVDDHEIVRFLGGDKQLWVWQIPGVLLQQTEVGQYGENARFRPAYYFLRLLETSLFGIDSNSWYFSRILMVALTSLFLTLGLIALLSFKNKLVIIFFSTWFILTILGLSAWQGIVARLGPTEIYLVLGISLFFYLATLLLDNPNSTKTWIATCLSVVAVVGSKENGIVALIPYIVLGCYVSYFSVKRRTVLWLFSITIAVSILIAIGWTLGVQAVGANVYGGSTSKQFFLEQFAKHLRDTSNSWEFLLSFSIVLIHIYANIITRKSMRYSVVTQILSQLSLGLSVILVMNTISMFKASEPILVSAAVLGFMVIFISSTYSNSVVAKANFESVASNAELINTEWQAQLERVNEDLSKKDFDVVVIQMNSVWDYEPAYATSQYLEFYASDLPRYLHLLPFPAGPGLETTLLNQLKVISEFGDTTWLIEPKSSLDSAYKKYCVTLLNAPLDPNLCDN